MSQLAVAYANFLFLFHTNPTLVYYIYQLKFQDNTGMTKEIFPQAGRWNMIRKVCHLLNQYVALHSCVLSFQIFVIHMRIHGRSYRSQYLTKL
jgi:hypothetical protein